VRDRTEVRVQGKGNEPVDCSLGDGGKDYNWGKEACRKGTGGIHGHLLSVDDVSTTKEDVMTQRR